MRRLQNTFTIKFWRDQKKAIVKFPEPFLFLSAHRSFGGNLGRAVGSKWEMLVNDPGLARMCGH